MISFKKTGLKISACVARCKYDFVRVTSMCLCVLGCDVECISYCGLWSKGLKATDGLKSNQIPDTVLNTLHALTHLILQPYEVGTVTAPNLHMGRRRHTEGKLVQGHPDSRRGSSKVCTAPSKALI